VRITATIAAILAAFFWSEAVLEASCVDEAAGDVAGQVAESQGYAA